MNEMCHKSALVGRILLGGIFFVSGIFSLMNFESFVALTGTAPILSIAPTLFAIGALIIKIGGGAFLTLGIHTRYSAMAILVFTFLATVLFHLDLSDQTQFIFFSKNVAIMGGLLAFISFGGGKYSIKK